MIPMQQNAWKMVVEAYGDSKLLNRENTMTMIRSGRIVSAWIVCRNGQAEKYIRKKEDGRVVRVRIRAKVVFSSIRM